MQALLLPCQDRQTPPRRHVHWPLDQDPHIPLPTIPTPPQGNCPNTTGQAQGHPHCSLVAKTALVPSATTPVLRHLSPPPPTTPPHTEQLPDPSSQLICSAPGSVEDSPSLMDVLHQAKKPSTRKACLYKWEKINLLLQLFLFLPSTRLSPRFRYLLHLKSSGLSFSSIKSLSLGNHLVPTTDLSSGLIFQTFHTQVLS